MKIFLLFVLVSLFGIKESHQNIISNVENEIKSSIELVNIDNYQTQRDLSAIWHTIVNNQAIRNVWESFKNVVAKINEQVKTWTTEIKDKVLVLTKIFEKRIDNMRDEFRKILEEAITTGDRVRDCLQGDKDVIEALMKEIFVNVTTCMSTQMNNIDKIEKSHNINIDDSLLYNEVLNKYNMRINCDEDCSNEIKDEIIIEVQNLQWNVSRQAFDTRNVINDSLDLIVKCVTEGLMKASSSITNETVKIIQCVKDQK